MLDINIDKGFNRHELISHFYSESGLNEQGKSVVQALRFDSYKEALKWMSEQFARTILDWRQIGAGSPYPKSLPNVIKIIERESDMLLENEIISKWDILSEEEKENVNSNFDKIFGSPELAQGINNPYCRNKYKNWLSLKEKLTT